MGVGLRPAESSPLAGCDLQVVDAANSMTRWCRMSVLTIERKVLKKNDALAAANRATIPRHGLFVLNIAQLARSREDDVPRADPGASEGSVAHRRGRRRRPDGPRRPARGAYGVPVVQIVTNGGCHLEASLVAAGRSTPRPRRPRPAHHRERRATSCARRATTWARRSRSSCCSTTEGDDKPLKYPGDVPERVGARPQQDRSVALCDLRRAARCGVTPDGDQSVR